MLSIIGLAAGIGLMIFNLAHFNRRRYVLSGFTCFFVGSIIGVVLSCRGTEWIDLLWKYCRESEGMNTVGNAVFSDLSRIRPGARLAVGFVLVWLACGFFLLHMASGNPEGRFIPSAEEREWWILFFGPAALFVIWMLGSVILVVVNVMLNELFSTGIRSTSVMDFAFDKGLALIFGGLIGLSASVWCPVVPPFALILILAHGQGPLALFGRMLPGSWGVQSTISATALFLGLGHSIYSKYRDHVTNLN